MKKRELHTPLNGKIYKRQEEEVFTPHGSPMRIFQMH